MGGRSSSMGGGSSFMEAAMLHFNGSTVAQKGQIAVERTRLKVCRKEWAMFSLWIHTTHV